MTGKTLPTISELRSGILKGNRVMLSRAITLVESALPLHSENAGRLIDDILPHTGKSLRIGITGPPGVGKSMFIEAFGHHLIETGRQIAVLPVDPTSTITKGSILGDKTRMNGLSKHENVYIRPSPSGSSLGGVARKTMEARLLCEAAGFEIIIIETVGVGQSETAVKQLADFFLLLMPARGGDELQGIKRGIMEMADAVAITKADGDHVDECQTAAKYCRQALHLFPAAESRWEVPVFLVSALTGLGLQDLWKAMRVYEERTKSSGFFQKNRSRQNLFWFRQSLGTLLEDHFFSVIRQDDFLGEIEESIADNRLSVSGALEKMRLKLLSVLCKG